METTPPVTIDAIKNCSTDGALKTTDFKLNEGDLLIVNVDPTMTWSAYRDYEKSKVNANGISRVTNEIDGLYKEAAFKKTGTSWYNPFEFALGSLIGTLDDGETYFPVGTHLEMTVLRDGNLSFLFWGGDQNTNEGFVRATVEVRESSSYAITDNPANNLDNEAKEFKIYAGDHSSSKGTPLNTKIELEPGDLLEVNVDPKELWNLMGDVSLWIVNANGVNKDGKGKWPDGKSIYRPINIKGHFKFRLGSLIGTLDGGETYFPVGTNLKMTVLSKGTLSFACADVDYIDNKGFVRAFVKVKKKGAVSQ